MFVDVITEGTRDKRSEAAMNRAVREAVDGFTDRLQRIQVRVEPGAPDHLCRLTAWSERGQVLLVERRGLTTRAALQLSLESLRRALASCTNSSPVSREMPGPGVPLPVDEAGTTPQSAAEDPRSAVAPRLDDGRHSCRVLLALCQLDVTAPSVHWGRVLSEALAASLHVCRVLGDVPSPTSLQSGPLWLDATRKLLAAQREARAWCSAALPRASLTKRALGGGSSIVAELAEVARQGAADWIVIPAGSANAALELARNTGCPVVVARPPTTRCTLLVATEPGRDNYPALERAACLSRALHAPMLAFHNAYAGLRPSRFVPQVDALSDPWRRICEGLPAAVGQRMLEVDVLLAHEANRVEALLCQGSREDADLIVTSVPAQGALDASRSIEVAAVVERADRSVMVVPTTRERASAELGTRATA